MFKDVGLCFGGNEVVVNSIVGSQHVTAMDFRRNWVLSLHRHFGSPKRCYSEAFKEEFLPLLRYPSYPLADAEGLITHANL